MDELKNKWGQAKRAAIASSTPVEVLITKARKKKSSVINFHYGNIIILTLTFIGISLFFIYVAPFQDTLSRIGMFFMLGGLLLRIVVECFSTLKSKKVQLVNETAQTANDALAYYAFRKKIHGPFTIIIVVFYSLGFYMLSPEFSRYIAFQWMVLIHVSYVLGAIFLIWQIRKGIQNEMRSLEELVALKKDMENG